MADPMYPLFPILVFITFIITLIPLPWHLQQWNAGTCLFMLWTSSVCLVLFTNSVVWSGNTANVAPVWCDISSQIIIASNAGLAASTVCISRRLYCITALRGAYATKAERRRALGEDLSISIGIPLAVCVSHLIVQPYRFQIIEDVGCYPSTYDSLLAYLLYYIWSIAMGFVALFYGCLALRQFHLRRAEISKLKSMKSINNDTSSTTEFLTVSRYIRLFILALIHVLCTIPVGIYYIYVSATQMAIAIAQGEPRRDWTKIQYIPSSVWRSDATMYSCIEINRWMPVFCGVVFFGIFGFASEARGRYKMWWRCIINRIHGRGGGEVFSHKLRSSWRWTPKSNRDSQLSGSEADKSSKHLLSHQHQNSYSSTFTPGVPMTPDPIMPHSSFLEYDDVELQPVSSSDSD
ncbi:pheromone receptor [Moniliophthora roreri MCA 2997]|uniref:Pheromone receptor n=1 Tax=Moniliophthora roreri (strain MCA 2997) TaxID=1381753 RepID=V2WKI9_MONRO|nr:pheromone receptor [Moniliophthora roreri MCA 2997]